MAEVVIVARWLLWLVFILITLACILGLAYALRYKRWMVLTAVGIITAMHGILAYEIGLW